ncbi:hypothetical protein C8F04DRAFT_1058622 [Mycena alexandri]|uniref:Uncharacterized protein n=1 Tax=Mycena alexandri TaxID=1745969 RepID=A0AAD6TJ96_9AGAR|nr:hypothetical protein C8F04DRAFT_1058622 [Mycena alexandri]
MTSPTNDASPAKRPYASAPDVTPHAATPADLALQLRNVGSRVRKTVTEGYNTQRSAPSSPTKPPPHAAIFTSANDVLHEIFGSAPVHPPISPKKRAREDDSDHESGDNMAVDSEAGRGNDIESDGETVIILDPRGARPVKPRPRRPLMQSQSLPIGVFGLSRGPLSGDNIAASMPEQIPEADWSANHSRTSSQPAFEPMVL